MYKSYLDRKRAEKISQSKCYLYNKQKYYMFFDNDMDYLWRDVKWDFFSTFKPYNMGSKESLHDLAQPYYGVRNIVNGLMKFLMTFRDIVYHLFADIKNASSSSDYLLYQIPSSIKKIAEKLVLSLALITRGATQIAASPLMLAKVLFRGLLTLLKPRENLQNMSDKNANSTSTVMQSLADSTGEKFANKSSAPAQRVNKNSKPVASELSAKVDKTLIANTAENSDLSARRPSL